MTEAIYKGQIKSLENEMRSMMIRRNVSIFMDDIHKFNLSVFQLINIYNAGCYLYNQILIANYNCLRKRCTDLLDNCLEIMQTLGKPVGHFLPVMLF